MNITYFGHISANLCANSNSLHAQQQQTNQPTNQRDQLKRDLGRPKKLSLDDKTSLPQDSE